MVGLEMYCGFTFFKDYMFGKSVACNGHNQPVVLWGYFHAMPWKPTIHGVETSKSSALGCEKTCSDLRAFFFFKSPFALWSLDILTCTN